MREKALGTTKSLEVKTVTRKRTTHAFILFIRFILFGVLKPGAIPALMGGVRSGACPGQVTHPLQGQHGDRQQPQICPIPNHLLTSHTNSSQKGPSHNSDLEPFCCEATVPNTTTPIRNYSKMKQEVSDRNTKT